MLNHKFNSNPSKNHKYRQNQKKQKQYSKSKHDYRSLLITALFTSSSLLPIFPVLAASPSPGTIIDNQATGSFTDPNDGSQKLIESNTVTVTVAEVAGISISQNAAIEEAPSGVDGAGANQGNNEINPEDVIYFTYKITNVGNDPTQFLIPDAPSSVNNGSFNASSYGAIQIIEYNPDGSSPIDLTSNNITVTNGGKTTGTLLNGIANTNDGSVPAGGSITIRVPIKVDSGLSDGDKVTVVMGDTAPNDNSAATQNQVYSVGTNDIYTEDNPDGTTGETNGTPINGDATNHRQEASYSQEATVAIATPTAGSPFICDSSLYMVIGNGGSNPSSTLNVIDRTTNPYTLSTIGSSVSSYNYNALAYNPVDNYLYAVVESANASSPYPSGTILKIGADGVPVSLGIPQGDTISFNPNAGTFLTDGTYVVTRQSNPIFTINLSTTPPTATNQGTTGARMEDIAVNPYDTTSNRVYGIDDNTDKVVYFDATNPSGGVTPAFTGATLNHNHGSQFYDVFGDLYYRSASTNSLYRVNPDGTAQFLASTGPGGSHDGASCFSVGLTKDVSTTDPVPAGQKVTYTYRIANSSSITMSGINLTDDLRSVTNYAGSTDTESNTPVNGTYGTINTPSGTITLSNNNQTLTISNITLAPKTITTVTAEVTIPVGATPNTYYNQAVLTGMPPTFISTVFSDYPSSILYQDPTPVQVTEPIASNPNVLLVKRITAINGNRDKNPNDNTPLNTFVDDTTSSKQDDDNNPNWPSNYLIGAIDAGKVKPGEEVEYTIYFLSTGDNTASNVLMCDFVPDNLTFLPGAYNISPTAATATLAGADRGIVHSYNSNTVSISGIQDGDIGQYFPSGVEPSTVYANIDCDGDPNTNIPNTNGAVVVNLGDLPHATTPGQSNSYGFVRFRGKVK